MAAPDDTALKALINSNIPDANPGLPRRGTAAFVRAALFTLIDWVKTAINGNLTTWLRTSDNQPGGSNADAIYRAGKISLTGSLDTKVQSTAATMAATALYQSALQVQGSIGSGPAYLEFLVPGVGIQQFGVDSDAVLKYRPYGAAVAYPILINEVSQVVKLASVLGSRRIVLYDATGNDHQFFGLGINSAIFRYQVSDTSSAHAFYAGLTPATSKELMRIQGNGLVDVTGMTRVKSFTVPTSDSGVEIIYGASPGNGAILCYDRTNGVYLNLNLDGATVNVNSGNATNGKMGVNTGSPTSALHVKGATGHQQLRLETSYTPTSSSDANGAIGQVAWDANYVYVKTTAGWKRTALSTF
ncbi:hypothetical protein GO755_39335 [Spirosoma sp. HMF4905]|uniref:Uncharacterized protein n=1 Tax=Spirosoma arboris TaxID=2682092 RepID=A0A7K1SQR1_9BACT|nr:hypothetical protein [Spirosoma arboris]MVM36132.1 hypothetical protein [Spirosoma arboris]